MDVRKLVYDKLENDSSLKSLLAKNGIYTTYSEDAGTYPVVVFSIVDDTPALHGDDKELYSHIRFQIAIITVDAEYDAIEKRVRKDMLELGAMRRLATEYREKKLHYRILQFIIANNIDND